MCFSRLAFLFISSLLQSLSFTLFLLVFLSLSLPLNLFRNLNKDSNFLVRIHFATQPKIMNRTKSYFVFENFLITTNFSNYHPYEGCVCDALHCNEESCNRNKNVITFIGTELWQTCAICQMTVYESCTLYAIHVSFACLISWRVSRWKSSSNNFICQNALNDSSITMDLPLLLLALATNSRACLKTLFELFLTVAIFIHLLLHP